MKEHDFHHWHDHEPENRLGYLLDRCGSIFAHRIGGGKRGQKNIMAVIAQHPGITQKELVDILGIQPASVSELLMKLEQNGLILRQKDDEDRRRIRVRLTEAGMRQQPTEETLEDPFHVLSPDEQNQLCVLLEKLLTDWQQRTFSQRPHHGDRQYKHYHHE